MGEHGGLYIFILLFLVVVCIVGYPIYSHITALHTDVDTYYIINAESTSYGYLIATNTVTISTVDFSLYSQLRNNIGKYCTVVTKSSNIQSASVVSIVGCFSNDPV